MFASANEGREQWRKISNRIHEEEQQLKELQLDYNEKLAIVEGLKVELRRIKHETQESVTKEDKFMMATAASLLQARELKQQYESMQLDREVLALQLATEQGALKVNQAKIMAARAMFEEQMAQQQAYVQQLLGKPEDQGPGPEQGQPEQHEGRGVCEADPAAAVHVAVDVAGVEGPAQPEVVCE